GREPARRRLARAEGRTRPPRCRRLASAPSLFGLPLGPTSGGARPAAPARRRPRGLREWPPRRWPRAHSAGAQSRPRRSCPRPKALRIRCGSSPSLLGGWIRACRPLRNRSLLEADFCGYLGRWGSGLTIEGLRTDRFFGDQESAGAITRPAV